MPATTPGRYVGTSMPRVPAFTATWSLAVTPQTRTFVTAGTRPSASRGADEWLDAREHAATAMNVTIAARNTAIEHAARA